MSEPETVATQQAPAPLLPTAEVAPTNLPAVVDGRADGGKMSRRDIVIGKHGIDFRNAADVMAFAHMMADSEFAVPAHCRGKPGVCLGIIDDALRFGMSPYALARESYVTKSRAGIENLAYMAKAVAAIIIGRAPIKGRPKISYTGDGVERVCKVVFVTLDGETIEHLSPKFGQITPKNSPLWTSDPDQQHGYYTLRSAGRLHFPDVLMGLYDLDEMGVDSPIVEARDAEPEKGTIATRLPGADVSHLDRPQIEKEMNGGSGAGDGALTGAGTGEMVPGTAGGAEAKTVKPSPFTVAEAKLIAELHNDLANAATADEVQAVIERFQPEIEAMVSAKIGSPEFEAQCDAEVEARQKAVKGTKTPRQKKTLL